MFLRRTIASRKDNTQTPRNKRLTSKRHFLQLPALRGTVVAPSRHPRGTLACDRPGDHSGAARTASVGPCKSSAFNIRSAPMSVAIDVLSPADWEQVRAIYLEGI